MKAYGLQWRMAGRRKDSCFLVIIFAAVATVFMLIYPQLIQSTREQLGEAYEGTVVKGWISNATGYDAPEISSDDWYTLLESGYFSEHATYMDIKGRFYKKSELAEYAGENASDENNLRAFQTMQLSDVKTLLRTIRAFNRIEASDDLLRMSKNIRWLEGYDGDCLSGNEHICLVPEFQGYELGDIIPVLVGDGVEQQTGIIRLKVVGILKGTIPEFDMAIPLKTAEELCEVAEEVYQEMGSGSGWKFTLNSFVFTVGNNRKIPELKNYLDELGFGAQEPEGQKEKTIRISIDDRILQGTVAPIESNLALLESLYLFFFVMMTAIGFFLCFLLVRGRKAEYAVMRMLGESTAQIAVKVLSEQSILCLWGIVFSSLFVLLTGWGTVDLLICAAILLCYSLGAAAAVLMTVRVNVMEILRDKE